MRVDAATLLNVPRWYEIAVSVRGRTDLVKEHGYWYPLLYLERLKEIEQEDNE